MKDWLKKLAQHVIDYFDLEKGGFRDELDVILKAAGMGSFEGILVLAKRNAEAYAKAADSKIAVAERELKAALEAYNDAVEAARKIRAASDFVANESMTNAKIGKKNYKKVLETVAKYSKS